MRKLFILVTIIFVGIVLYFGFTYLPQYFSNISIVVSNANSNSANLGDFAFKNTPENLELINSYIKVNNSFINEMSKELTLDKSIKNIYGLINSFPNFKTYYSARLKLEKAVFEGFPYLINNTLNLSTEELKSFLDNNLDYLDKTFGITTYEQLSNITTNLSYLITKQINYAEIPTNSAVYNPYGESTIFRIKAGSDLNDFVSFSVNVYHGYNTTNQKAPVMVFDALGGMS